METLLDCQVVQRNGSIVAFLLELHVSLKHTKKTISEKGLSNCISLIIRESGSTFPFILRILQISSIE